ncbi:26S proteasome non-ATPase regulatory subunit 1 [Desmophyllum pertusum]|uniref:26S proteasome non-ATPase regulatory subunit 1 n=1 Tax=Desmophyllum pertusum TaxID=174260 RepID=A0A9X0CK00_9CNID|nr:26S proteasome non-ATPase regulatory subunit 1 [Desmophyllum pertusum]
MLKKHNTINPLWSLVRNCIELVKPEQIVCYINELECVEGSAYLAVPAGLAELDGKFECCRQRLDHCSTKRTTCYKVAKSYNPHVRYGAALALGVACAGTGLKEAIGLLELQIQQ